MKYFICTLAGVQLAIPEEKTDRIIVADRTLNESGNGKTCISLPALFKLEDDSAPHAVVLKSGGILLTPKIDIELDIPEESIQKLPDTLSGLFRCFIGAVFSGEKLILILDPEKLLDSVKS